ncbi:MAG: helix-turn-helix transcriptional regulator [Clostridia bacterium]|nr:helix-turn-helix transcriptional regulator [Clostridia bacterium]
MGRKTIKDLRINMGLSQEEASKEFKIHKRYLSMIENGKRNPSDKLKIKMANLYKTTIGVIFLALETTKCSIKKGE